MEHPETNTRDSIQTPSALRFGFWICCAIGVAVVLRRAIALTRSASSASPPDLARLDAWFQTHAALTYAHIFTALAFLCVLPLIFWSRTQQSALVRRTFYALGPLVGITAYAMSAYSVGGWVERSAVLFFNSLFVISIGLSFRAWMKGMAAEERRWTLRSAAIVLGISTTRPVMGIFFATSRLTHLTPRQFFGPAFWIGFSINVLVMEFWLRRSATRRIGLRAPNSMTSSR